MDVRLPFMDPADIMAQGGFTYMAVWRSCGLTKHDKQRVPKDPDTYEPGGPTEPIVCLTCDALSSKGAFVESVKSFELTQNGGTMSKDGALIEGVSLPWKCFWNTSDKNPNPNTTMVEFIKSMPSSEDPRKEFATQHDIRGCFAMFRDGAVYEFGGPSPMEEPPWKMINGIAKIGCNAVKNIKLIIIPFQSYCA